MSDEKRAEKKRAAETHTREQWVMTDGKHLHRDENGTRRVLRPGDTFFPTEKQANSGSLANKARPSGGTKGATVSVGVDFDADGRIVREDAEPAADAVQEDATEDAPSIEGLPWGSKAALSKAQDAEPPVTFEEMQAVSPTGDGGKYVSADVDTALAARG